MPNKGKEEKGKKGGTIGGIERVVLYGDDTVRYYLLINDYHLSCYISLYSSLGTKRYIQ